MKTKTKTVTAGRWTADVNCLAPREAEMVCLVASGMTNKGAGRAMNISHRTAEKTLSRVMYKLHTFTRAETVAEAVRRGILHLMLLMMFLNGAGIGLEKFTRPRLRQHRVNTYRIEA